MSRAKVTTKPVAHPRRVMIVDDHPLVRDGLERIIASQPDLVVGGEAASADDALQMLAAAKPDVLITDLTLSGKNGLELIKDLHVSHPGLPVLVVSMHEEELYAERALRAGARGYCMKQEPGEKVVEALRVLLQGGLYVSAKMAETLLHTFLNGRPTKNSSEEKTRLLSNREIEVLELIGQGNCTTQIAERLRLSRKTIETYRMHLKRKLGLDTSAKLVHYAIRWVEKDTASGKT